MVVAAQSTHVLFDQGVQRVCLTALATPHDVILLASNTYRCKCKLTLTDGAEVDKCFPTPLFGMICVMADEIGPLGPSHVGFGLISMLYGLHDISRSIHESTDQNAMGLDARSQSIHQLSVVPTGRVCVSRPCRARSGIYVDFKSLLNFSTLNVRVTP